jgi:membrane-associated phospholipid phosphatase
MRKQILSALTLLLTLNTFAQTDSLYTADSSMAMKAGDLFPVNPEPGNGDVYTIKKKVDIPVTLVGVGWSIYCFTKIYSKDKSTEEEILSLNKNDLASYNRWGVDVYHPKAADASDMLFYSSMPLPLLLLADKKIRQDAGKIGFLYLESMAVTGLLYTSSTYFVDKHRPYTYNPDVPIEKRMGGGGKNSFFAGHVALVGTSTFFMARVISDYHPDSKMNWLFYTLAAAATGTTGYLRSRGGMHFIDDIVIGTTVGTLTGLMIPKFHRNPKDKRTGFQVIPFYGREKGLSLVYKFK